VTHIPNNVPAEAIVAVRPMRRSDVDALAAWGVHDDPLFRHYNLPILDAERANELWLAVNTTDAGRPYVGLVDDRLAALLMVRDIDAAQGSGELGITLDPAWIGRGWGTRILRAFVSVLEREGFRRLHLEVAGYNPRAIGAYRAAGFAVLGEEWGEPEPGLDVDALLEGPAAARVLPHLRLEPDGRYRSRIVRMERRLIANTKDETSR